MGRYKRSLSWAFDQFVNRTCQDVAYKYDGKFCKPSRIIFCLTLRCNIQCRQCGIWRTENKKELTTEEWKKVIIDLKKWLGPYRVQIAGGEIFLRNDIVELIRFASENNVLIGMVSNGTMIDAKMSKNLIDAGLSYIDISIDGVRPETHDYIRGVNGVYDKAIATIRHLKNYSREVNSQLSITAATIIMGANMGELIDVVKLAEKEGINGVIFNPLGPACDSDPHWQEHSELWPKPEDLGRLDSILDELIVMKKAGAPILNSVDQFIAMKSHFRDPLVPRGSHCMVGVTNFLLSCDGEVHLCFHMPSIGNFRQPLREVWASEKVKKVRQEIRQCAYECSPGNFIYRRSLIKEIQRFLQYR